MMKFGSLNVMFTDESPKQIVVDRPVYEEAFIMGQEMYYDFLTGHPSPERAAVPHGKNFAKITGIKWARAVCSRGLAQAANLVDVKKSFELGMTVAHQRWELELINPNYDISDKQRSFDEQGRVRSCLY